MRGERDHGRRALIVVENLSVPLDRRVWQQSLALRAAGWEVTVICPRGTVRDTEPYASVEGIAIHRYDLTAASGGRMSYLREYLTAFRRVLRLVRRLSREGRFAVIHVCNPPDILMLAARLGGGRRPRLVFDHHDLFPELYAARYGRSGGALYGVARALERVSYRLADVVIVPNDSYRDNALTRGGKTAADVFVVRNAPDLARFTPVAPNPALRRGRPHLVAYLGLMGPQDGVDHALRALATLHASRQDWNAVFMGDGDVLPAMVRLAGKLGISDHVEFTGMVGDDRIVQVLSTADVCIAPDPPNAFNDRSTMNKIVEYMAIGRPVACYDLPEARVSAEAAAVYATAGDTTALAGAIASLLDDAPARERLGAAGRARVEGELSWTRSAEALRAAYDRAVSR
jgi:glycosyltransferase involved in cell wall biosynthesis